MFHHLYFFRTKFFFCLFLFMLYFLFFSSTFSSAKTKKKAVVTISVSHSYKSKRLLKHTKLSVSKQINPWNHTLILYSSRILLRSEVRHSSLTLSQKTNKKSAKIIKAKFLSLSKNGRKITYQLNAKSRHYLCSGDGTKNGFYKITSSLFTKSLLTKYRERLSPNTLSGFVLSQTGSPVPSAKVFLQNERKKKVKSTKTDPSGYYCFRNISNSNLSISVQKKGYANSKISSLQPAKKSLCQNIILAPLSEKNLAVTCILQNEQCEPLSSTSVILTDSSSHPIAQGKTDQEGRITFSNIKKPISNGFSLINYHKTRTHASFQNHSFPQSNFMITPLAKALKRRNTYYLTIVPKDSASSIKYQRERFSFSFSSFLTDQVVFQVQLQKLSILNPKKISVNMDTLSPPKVTPSNLSFSLYSSVPSSSKAPCLFHANVPLHKALVSPFSLSETTLPSLLQEKSVYIEDGSYYIHLQGLNSSLRPISSSSFFSIKVQDGFISPVNCTLFTAKNMKILLYGNFPVPKTPSSLSFHLFQQYHSIWFPVQEVSSSILSSVSPSSCKAFINLYGITAKEKYLLISSNPNYSIIQGQSFSTKADTLFSNLSNLTVPSHQIICQFEKLNQIFKSSADLETSLSSIPNTHHINTQFLQTSDSYPNTVYAFYQSNGTLLSTFLTSKSFYPQKNRTFYDCYTNGATLRTSQPVYRSTPFFVT